jgi:Zn-dependent protease
MKWSFYITTLLGTQVRIHATFALLLAFVAWESLQHGGSARSAVEAVLLICVMFFCVLLHEFGHILAARSFGIRTPDVTLLPIGGVARLERMPRRPLEELIVALAGPLVNVLIAILLTPFVPGPLRWTIHSLEHSTGILEMLRNWNLFMVAFNLLPVFPMDGGRVLRAIIHYFTRNYQQATRTAASLGQAIAILLPLALWVLGLRFSPMLILTALFIFVAAGSEANQVEEEEALHQLRVKDALMTDFHILKGTDSLHTAVDALLAGSQHDFPIMDEQGRLLGILYRNQIPQALRDAGVQAPLASLVQPCSLHLREEQALAPVLQEMKRLSTTALPVSSASGKLIGLLTLENVYELLLVRAAQK